MSSVPRAALLAGAAAALLALVPTSAAVAADPAPFGHACTPQNGVRFCPTPDLASRPASFDGTPIDVDVTLPATGDGPFPTILLLHGLGGTKTSFETRPTATSPTPTGPSPGGATRWSPRRPAASATPAARRPRGPPAARRAGPGWATCATRSATSRRSRARSSTRASCARRDRLDRHLVRRRVIDHAGVPQEPRADAGRQLRAVDEPEGHADLLDRRVAALAVVQRRGIFTRNGRGPWSRTPTGVEARPTPGGIFGVAVAGFIAPTGGDLSTDITRWKAQLDAAGSAPPSSRRSTTPTTSTGSRACPAPGAAAPAVGLDRRAVPGRPVARRLRPHPRAEPDRAGRAADRRPRPQRRPPTTPRTSPRRRPGAVVLRRVAEGQRHQAGARRGHRLHQTCPLSAAAGGGPYKASSSSGSPARTCASRRPRP